MYLSQVLRTPGMHLIGVADLSPERARQALRKVGWPAERLGARSFEQAAARGTTRIVDDAIALIAVAADRRRDRRDRQPGGRHRATCSPAASTASTS